MPAKASTDLFDLIKSLDSGEKRYFKLQAQLQKGTKNYLLLFDAIDRQTEYNEAKIKRKFEGQAFARQISVAKNYLYNLILDALEAYHENEALEVRRMAHKAEILLNRGLREQSGKVLARAREKAERTELFLELIDIQTIEWRLKFENARDYSTLGEESKAMLSELKTIVDKLHNIGQYKYGVAMMPFIQTDRYRTAKREKIHEELRTLLRNPLISSDDQVTSLRARGFYLSARGHIFNALGMQVESVETRRQQMELDFNNIEIFGIENCLVSVHNLGTALIGQGRFHELKELIERIDTISTNKTYSRQGRIISRGVYTKTLLQQYYLLGSRTEAPELLDAMLSEVERHAKIIGSRRRSSIIMLFAMLYLRHERFERSLELAMQFLNDTPPTILRDFHVLMRFTAMMCLYESGEILAVEHGIKALKRFTTHPELSTEYERNMFAALNKLLRAKTGSEEREVFREIYHSMADLHKQQSGYAAVLQPVFLEWIERHADKYS